MTTTAKLFAAVYANPDDDGPRSVLADLLQEQGDPRGEFIALQLARGRGGKKTRRESQLLKPNTRKWLGPLTCVPNRGLVYERGFLAACQMPHEKFVEPHPEWATVEKVEIDRAAWRGSFQVAAETLPSLRALTTNGHAGQLTSHPKLEKIVVGYVFEEKDHQHLAKLKLPALREFDCSHCHATLPMMKPFLRSAKALQRLSLGVEDPPAWIPWLARQGYEHAGVRSTMIPWILGFAGERITAEYIYSGHQEPQAGPQLAKYLRCVPSPGAWHVTITQRYSWAGTSEADAIRGCGAVLKKFASHVVEPGEKSA